MCRNPRFTSRLLTASLSKLVTWRGAFVKPKRYVVSRGPADRWEIGFDLISVGPFDSEAAAIQSAIKAAFNAGKQNPAGSEVLVQQADGTLRVVWAFGNDPAPT
jgi:hypothetical protein